MASLPDLVGRLRLDMSDLERARGEATQRGAAIGSALGSAVGSLAGGALAAASAKVTEFVSGSVDAFARLEDATSVTGVRFGSAASSVEDFATRAAKGLGMSKAEALEASNTFSVFGKQIDLTGQPLADFSTGMTQLAGDMASFVGTSPEEAITAIGAAFRGEYDPIEKYGVSINAAAVKAKALEMGLKPVNGELTQQQKVLATQQLILEQTSQAQGDFARTSDSVANSQKRVKAETENAQAALGQKLAPAYLAVLNALNAVVQGITVFLDKMTPIVQKIWEWRDAIAAVGVVLLIMNARMIAFNVAAAAYLAVQSAIRIATVAWTTVQWLLNAALTANPIGIVVTVIAALVAGIIVAYNHSETFRNFIDKLWATIRQGLADIPAKWEEFKNTVVTMFNNAVQKGQEFINWWANLPSAVGTAIAGFGESLWQNIVVAGWNRVTTFVTQDIPRWIQSLVQGLADFGNRALAGINQGWEWVKNIWSQANTFLIQSITGWISGIVNGLADFGNRALGNIQRGWEFTKTTWNQANQDLVNRAGQFVTDTANKLAPFVTMLKEKVIAAWEAVPPGIRKPIEDVVNAAIKMAQDILNSLKNLPSEMVTMGQQIIDGLLNGLKSKGQQIVDYLTNLIPGPVRQALGISSPSSVMHEIGDQTIQGLINGMKALMPQVQTTLNQIISIINSVKSALGISSPSSMMEEIGQFIMQGLDQGLQSWIPKIQSTLNQVVGMVKQHSQQLGQIAEDGSKVAAGFYDEIMLHGQLFKKGQAGYAEAAKRIGLTDAQINATTTGISGSAKFKGQQVSGSVTPQGQISGSFGGQSFSIDARSFGTQLNPKDVVDQILWKAKAGGLVPA